MLLTDEPVQSLHQYRERGGLAGLDAARRLGAVGVIEELMASGLRGRGGAGFPAGVKWQAIASGGPAAGNRFVVANGAEGEPGTFKDRAILRHNPYALVEGVMVAAMALGAERAFIALKSSFEIEAERVATAAAEMAEAGHGGDVQIELVRGPDEYLFGEEKALLEVIEGEDPLPRLFPPYIYGLFTTSPQVGWSAGRTLDDADRTDANPTLVNNVETLATVPAIMAKGADWYRSRGTPESPGSIVCTVSGDTVRHGVGEFDMGTPLREVIDVLGGGVGKGRTIRYVLAGISNPVIRGDQLDTPLTYEDMEAIGTGLGTGGFIVFDDRTDPVELARAVSRFLYVESCGQCPACKLGTGAITDLLGAAERPLDPRTTAELTARLSNVTDSSRCFLPSQEQRLVASLARDMRTEALGREPRGITITKIVDFDNGQWVLDDRQAHKLPDWTYTQG